MPREASQQAAIDTIRMLAADAVQAANSGHPGTPMALAPVAVNLWDKHLRFDPANPSWSNRDRFVLSCGHASMLLYGLLHLAKVQRPSGELAVSLADIQDFRQWQSVTPGHPEHGHTVGVETTTGPLGQGCGNSVGMAIASKWLAARYNREGFCLFDFNTYALVSDGDLMEGVAAEAASLAGHLRLDNLCWLYDDNRITIDGPTSLAFSENVSARFESLGWKVHEVHDAEDSAALDSALEAFQQTNDRPTLIVVRSIIGRGAPTKAGTSAAHGAPLGRDEIAGAREFYNWPDEEFHVPAEATAHFEATLAPRGAELQQHWQKTFAEYRRHFPAEHAELTTLLAGELPAGWDEDLPTFDADKKGIATRASSGKALNALAPAVPWLLGGSADLAGSNKSDLAGEESFASDCHSGRILHFGIREHAMASIANGMALSGLRPFVATFFVFTDYLRPALRLASLMKLPVVYVLTHDSIGVGEDGPTHQPIEHLAACRAIPGVQVIRPADANETAAAWRHALATTDRPSLLVLTRQNVPTLATDAGHQPPIANGGYVAMQTGEDPQVVLIATGSELQLAVSAAEQLAADGCSARVVSMPCLDAFEMLPADAQAEIVPPQVPARVVVEAGIRQGWEGLLGPYGEFVGLSDFGASAPAERVFKELGLTVDQVVAAAKRSRAKTPAPQGV